MGRVLTFILALMMVVPAVAAKDTKTEKVILITLDGLRWREVFTGIDPLFLEQKKYMAMGSSPERLKNAYWREDEVKRRELLFPFLWNTIAKEGQLYGNRNKGSKVTVKNGMYFSYPGYSVILTGIADPRIDSNAKMPNPNKTFLEVLNDMPVHKGKVGAFASWDVFPYIWNAERSGIVSNAGFGDFTAVKNDRVADLNQMQKDTPSPWDNVGLDVFTHNFAVEYLKNKRPDALYIAYGETDDFAHHGEYDQYINSAHRTDDFIARIWQWVESDPEYAGKTTLLITSDHGRGYPGLEGWKGHGHYTDIMDGKRKMIPEADSIWMAVIGPDTPATGEMQNVAEVTQSQVAATLMKFMGQDYVSSNKNLKAGKPVASMMKK